MRGVLLLLLIAILAGCVSSAPGKAQPAALANSTAPGTRAAAHEASREPPANATPTKILPVSFNGAFDPGACVLAAVAGLCPGLPVQSAEASGLGQARRVLGGALTMTWSADSPINAELGMTLASVRSCGADCTEMRALGNATIARGASPVTLKIATPAAVDTGTLGVFVWKPCEVAQPPVIACAYTNQAFQIAGSLTVEDSGR